MARLISVSDSGTLVSKSTASRFVKRSTRSATPQGYGYGFFEILLAYILLPVSVLLTRNIGGSADHTISVRA